MKFTLTILAIAALFLAGCNTAPFSAMGREGCDLMQSPEGEQQCYGCAEGICNDAPAGYALVERDSGRCAAGDQGCYLQDTEDDDEDLGDKIEEEVREEIND